jgi:hypothetical protein
VGVCEALSFIFTSKLPDERDATGLTACCLSSSSSFLVPTQPSGTCDDLSFHLLLPLCSFRQGFLNVENFSSSFFDFGWVLKGVRRRAGAPSGPAGTLRGFDMAVSGSFVFPTLLCLFF